MGLISFSIAPVVVLFQLQEDSVGVNIPDLFLIRDRHRTFCTKKGKRDTH